MLGVLCEQREGESPERAAVQGNVVQRGAEQEKMSNTNRCIFANKHLQLLVLHRIHKTFISGLAQ